MKRKTKPQAAKPDMILCVERCGYAHEPGKHGKPQAAKPLPFFDKRDRASLEIHYGKSCAALIIRRVNQGPAFDAMEDAAAHLLQVIEAAYSDANEHTDLNEVADKFRAALKLAQEVK